MVEPSEKFWRDGEILDWQAAGSTSLLTHTLHYGVGAFEGIRAYQRADGSTCVFRREHMDVSTAARTAAGSKLAALQAHGLQSPSFRTEGASVALWLTLM